MCTFAAACTSIAVCVSSTIREGAQPTSRVHTYTELHAIAAGATADNCHCSWQGAKIYISGSAEKMPQDVMKALEDVVQQHGDLTAQEAQAYVRQLELSRRCHVEAWS